MLMSVALKTDYDPKIGHQSRFELQHEDGLEPPRAFKVVATDPRFQLVLFMLRRLKGDPTFVDLEDMSIFGFLQLAGHKCIGTLNIDNKDIAALGLTSRLLH